MTTFKCKMCGGALEDLSPDMRVGTCSHCGSTMTLPRLDSERKQNLYDRAGHLRRANDFDKAEAIYGLLLSEDPGDAEAYWSLVLCRYGVEYVEDPKTHKRVMTCHRTQKTPVFADSDYKAALAHADGASRAVYEQEAAALDAIQKGILAISEQEKPYDVFICYKESDAAGRRTPDSVLAQELYYELVEEGFNVFFSRITLEDKLGVEYEPYIYAALNSARVMVAVGTRAENLNAVWVKNEWGRYLRLINSGADKVLIPAYRDMDPYDLPEEFSHLQAQDMAKLGFMQDLVRGIKKILEGTQAQASKPEPKQGDGAVSSLEGMLDRAFLFLEDGDWLRADELLEQVLNANPRLAKAYVGKLMAQRQVRQEEDFLSYNAAPLTESGDYQKALRFADEEYRGRLAAYGPAVEKNIAARIQEERYQELVAAFVRTDLSTQECDALAEEFRQLDGYEDSARYIDDLAARKEQIIEENRRKQQEAIRRREEMNRLQAEKKAQEKKKFLRFAAVAVVALALAIWGITASISHSNKTNYEQATQLLQQGEYQEAIDRFERIAGYADSSEKINEAKYYLATDALAEGDYASAEAIFNEVMGYQDSSEWLLKIQYVRGMQYILQGQYQRAAEAFGTLGNYSDSQEMRDKALLLYGAKNISSADGYRVLRSMAGDPAVEAILLSNGLTNLKLERHSVFGPHFGALIQEDDADEYDWSSRIRWEPLYQDENKALLLSEDILLWESFYGSSIGATWEKSKLREYLNDTLFYEIFNETEQRIILEVENTNPDNTEFGTPGGNNTVDRLFVLSEQEVEEYFKNITSRSADYSDAVREELGGGFSWNSTWWLRTPGKHPGTYAVIANNGAIHTDGEIGSSSNGVRLAVWVDINAIPDASAEDFKNDILEGINDNLQM